MDLGPICGKENTTIHLVDLFLRLLQDEFSDVRLNIISKLVFISFSFSLFLYFFLCFQTFPHPLPFPLLPFHRVLSTRSLVLTCSNKPSFQPLFTSQKIDNGVFVLPSLNIFLLWLSNWFFFCFCFYFCFCFCFVCLLFFGVVLITLFPLYSFSFFFFFQGVANFDEKLSPLCFSLLNDSVFNVRKAATVNLRRLAGLFGEEWVRNTLLPQIGVLKDNPNYLYRMTTLFSIKVFFFFFF